MFPNMKIKKWLLSLSLIAVVFTYVVIGVGAFTRLSDAGLGCPDWPACYGKLIAKKNINDMHINIQKAQIEMGHRYVAGLLGLLIIVIVLLCAMTASYAGFRFLIFSVALFVLLLYQVLLGMLTVTLKLSPLIVTQHLLVGMMLLALLWLIYLNVRQVHAVKTKIITSLSLKVFATFCLLLLIMQIILGAWTSSHDVGLIYGGFSAVHRWAALIVGCAFLSLYFWIKKTHRSNKTLKNTVHFLLALLFLQVVLGAANVLFQLPLLAVIAHNLVAATMLLVMVTINYGIWYHRSQITDKE